MPYSDFLILMGVGGLFILIGLVAVFWGKTEEKRYYDALTNRTDVREYMEHWPRRPEPGAWKVGGWIALAIGLILLVVGGIFWILG